jgi:hypothetical protein
MSDDAIFPDLFVPWNEITLDEIAAFESALNEARIEADMQRFLEDHPRMLIQQVRRRSGAWVIPQKRLGAEYVPDFLLAEKDSGGLRWYAVELERPQAKMFKKNGDPSAELTHALRQISDWRDWLSHNRDYAARPSGQSGRGLIDIDPELEGLIIIGRDSDIDESTAARRRRLARNNRVEIETYDWLLSQARERAEGFDKRAMARAGVASKAEFFLGGLAAWVGNRSVKPTEKAVDEAFGERVHGWTNASLVRGEIKWEGVELWPYAHPDDNGVAPLQIVHAYGVPENKLLDLGDWEEWIDHVAHTLDADRSLLVTEIAPDEDLRARLTLERDGIWYAIEWIRLRHSEELRLGRIDILVHLPQAINYHEKRNRVAVAREVFRRNITLDRERKLQREREAELKVISLSLTPGDRVEHTKFGFGTVQSTSGSGTKAEAMIDFGEDLGVKRLVLLYAPLKKV